MGSPRERKEMEILELQKDLIAAKTQNMNSSQEMKALYEEAVKAMSDYQGHGGSDG